MIPRRPKVKLPKRRKSVICGKCGHIARLHYVQNRGRRMLKLPQARPLWQHVLQQKWQAYHNEATRGSYVRASRKLWNNGRTYAIDKCDSEEYAHTINVVAATAEIVSTVIYDAGAECWGKGGGLMRQSREGEPECAYRQGQHNLCCCIKPTSIRQRKGHSRR